MALSYDTITALINDEYLPRLYNQIFSANHYLLAVLKKKAKTYNERKIVVPLEYAEQSNIGFLSRFEGLAVSDEEILAAAEYEPKMFSGSLAIPLEDELRNMSKNAIGNLLSIRVKNLERSMQKTLARHIWVRGTTLAASKNWNTLDFLVNDTSATVGAITMVKDTTNAWWQSNQIVLGTDYNDDPTSEDDLIDESKDVFLKKLLQRGIAKCKYLQGEDPTVIIVPQYIWDLLEFVLDPQKTGSKLNEKAGSMGFKALDYRGIPIVPDDDMVYNQTGDTDGRMYFLNENYLYMFFNSGAKFKATEFVRPANANYRVSLVNAYGNLVISNRKVHTVMTGLRSPKSYAA